ncbi:hypothetical protein ACF0H5_007311 [Mactra antiquata]
MFYSRPLWTKPIRGASPGSVQNSCLPQADLQADCTSKFEQWLNEDKFWERICNEYNFPGLFACLDNLRLSCPGLVALYENSFTISSSNGAKIISQPEIRALTSTQCINLHGYISDTMTTSCITELCGVTVADFFAYMIGYTQCYQADTEIGKTTQSITFLNADQREGSNVTILQETLTNLVFPALIVGISLGVSKTNGYGNDRLTGIRSICVLVPVMGLTWVFGILSVNQDLVVFQYIFSIFNALQGLCIFLFHCVFNKRIRDALKHINARRRSLQTFSSDFRKRTDGRDTDSRIDSSEGCDRQERKHYHRDNRRTTST